MSKLFIFVLFISSFLLNACYGIKPQSSGKAKKYYESFYLGDGKSQYYIKPLEFENKTQNLVLDFTIRQSEDVIIDGVTNFSLYSPILIDNIDSLNLNAAGNTISINEIKRLFIEKEGKKYHLRNTANITKEFVETFFGAEDIKLMIYAKNNVYNLAPIKSTNKNRKLLFENLIQLIILE